MSELQFAVEKWQDCKDAMSLLWPFHWDEVAGNKDKIQLDVWLEAFDKLAIDGQLTIVTARFYGDLVGYHWSIIRPHLHYKSSLTAYTDIFFLLPEHRKGMNGVNLFKFVEQVWKSLGVQKAYISSKVKLDMSVIFERLGWTRSEVVYTKMIGE